MNKVNLGKDSSETTEVPHPPVSLSHDQHLRKEIDRPCTRPKRLTEHSSFSIFLSSNQYILPRKKGEENGSDLDLEER